MNTIITRRDFVLGAAATALALPVAPVFAQEDTITSLDFTWDRDFVVDLAQSKFTDVKLFDTNCAFFLSTVLWGAGLPKTDEWTDLSTNEDLLATWRMNPGPTVASSLARAFVDYLTKMDYATMIPLNWGDDSAQEAQRGDILAYCWGTGAGDGEAGTIDHVGMVSEIDPDGFPRIIEHSPDNRDRYWSYSILGDDWIEYAYPEATAYLIRMDFIATADF